MIVVVPMANFFKCQIGSYFKQIICQVGCGPKVDLHSSGDKTQAFLNNSSWIEAQSVKNTFSLGFNGFEVKDLVFYISDLFPLKFTKIMPINKL